MMDLCAHALTHLGVEPRRLVSGAGHDAMIIARVAPVGMIFVRCRGGISHNPLESITPEDADLAVRALMKAVRGFEVPVGRAM
jgi:acetylornithine deacetylase/succinyl-diaminopimelate desuccinylase-like protein